MNEDLEEIRDAIAAHGEFLCVAHQDADADSLGSALAFAEYLDVLGKKVAVVAPSPVPRSLAYLPGFDRVNSDAGSSQAVAVAFDAGSPGRFGDLGPRFAAAPLTMLFDHHVSNQGFGDFGVVDRGAAATGVIVLRVLQHWGAKVTGSMATNLYAALFTDTGGFRHDNTSADVLRAGAELADLGADPVFVALKSYKSRPATTLRLQALVTSAAHYELGDRLIWSEVTQAMLTQAGAEMQESEGIIDLLQSLDNMLCAVLFKEEAGLTKVSIRTRGQLAAHELVAGLGGGGHFRAAGAEVRAPLQEVKDRLLPELRSAVSREAGW